MIEMRRASTRMKSLRSLIAVGGAAAMAFGLAQATGTLANPTDVVNSTGAQVATGNFYPTPLTSTVNCSTSGGADLLGRRANLSWPAVPGVTGYKVVFVRKSDPSYIARTDNLSASQTSISGITHGSRNVMWARVYTVNGPAISSGFMSSVEITHKDLVSNRTECEGNRGPQLANQAWENTNTWNPATPAPNGGEPSEQDAGRSDGAERA